MCAGLLMVHIPKNTKVPKNLTTELTLPDKGDEWCDDASDEVVRLQYESGESLLPGRYGVLSSVQPVYQQRLQSCHIHTRQIQHGKE